MGTESAFWCRVTQVRKKQVLREVQVSVSRCSQPLHPQVYTRFNKDLHTINFWSYIIIRAKICCIFVQFTFDLDVNVPMISSASVNRRRT